MAEAFVITANYKNQQQDFEGTFTPFGFSYRLEIMIDGLAVVFEPDEERNYRAYLPPGNEYDRPLPDPILLKAIAEALEKAFK